MASAKPHVLFSHGNSFPGGTYRKMLDDLKARGFDVLAIDRYGHDPRYPVSNNWTHLVEQLADTARRWQKQGKPAFLVGHSLGGMLSMMCAARHPELARGVVLIDSPMIGGWKAASLGLAKRTPLIGSLSPGRVSRQRRNHWPDQAAAHAYLASKKIFAAWDPEVLQDYVNAGTEMREDGCWLRFDRDIETAIYNTLPDNLARLIRRHPLKCPASFIGGTRSVEMRTVGMELTRQVCKDRLMMLDGSHLFPMEKPVATAAALEAALRNLGA